MGKVCEYNFRNENITEGMISRKVMPEEVKTLSSNVRSIWNYAVTEILNNAIEHSGAENISVRTFCNDKFTEVTIQDDGIGIFNSIARHYGLADIEDAVFALYKGKQTTALSGHSGEGIFFTSRIMDCFRADSYGKEFYISRDAAADAESACGNTDVKGTKIIMILSNTAKQELSEIFDTYTTDAVFDTTEIPVRMVADFGFPVSRSEARRLVFGLEKFRTAILDFEGVDMIGQSFAHELFSVFSKSHPEISLKCINLTAVVEKMIRHVGGV